MAIEAWTLTVFLEAAKAGGRGHENIQSFISEQACDAWLETYAALRPKTSITGSACVLLPADRRAKKEKAAPSVRKVPPSF